MAIYINGRYLLQPQTGVNRFAYELTKAMVGNGVDLVVVCPNGKIHADYDISTFPIRRCGFGKSHFWEQFILPFYFLFKRDILVNFTSLGPLFIRRKVMTIHDLAFYENPKWYSKSYVWFYKIMTPLCAKTSKCILTVSEFSKKEIHKYLGVSKDKIHVIYNAVADKFKHREQGNLANRYILAVSTMDPRKNFRRLVDAFIGWENTLNAQLYLVGGRNSIFTETSIAENPNIRWLGRVSDEELVKLYQGATCFIYPSLYEGFGIPPLEAMSSGSPVIVSDIQPLREVCGDAAIYIDPMDVHSIRAALSQIVDNEKLRDALIIKGCERLKLFTWTKSAKKLTALISALS